ncbi:MAG: DUF2695 domain-containing protein [Defluviitaleaceae bacterium]|nr:DUF2695 domain-containing protein [Defluviitaleaceae bacterium]
MWQKDRNGFNFLAEISINSRNILAEPVLSFLREHGGYCDCEVLSNVEENFRDDAIF